MSSFLLDTTTISDYLKRDRLVTASMLRVNPNDIYISAVSKYEIAYGLYKKPSLISALKLPLSELYRLTNDLSFTTEVAQIAGRIANELKVVGQPIGVGDVLIASTALSENLTLVSSNTKHFSRIGELKLVDWKSESAPRTEVSGLQASTS